MPKELSKTLGKFRTGIFQELTEKYHSLLSRGETVYNLYVGTPDLLPDRRVTAAVAAAAADPENYKYSIVELPALKKALIDYYKKRYGVELDPDAITATNGTQDSMAHIGIALCNKGDLVMIPDPGYPVFESGVLFSEADPYYYQLLEKNNYLLDFESVPEDVWQRTKYIVTSYPSNPCGALAPKEFYVKLIEYAKKYGFYIVNDNVYSDIIFDGSEGFSFLSIEGAKDVGIEFFSLSKSFNLTGARISFALGNKRLVDAMKVIDTVKHVSGDDMEAIFGVTLNEAYDDLVSVTIVATGVDDIAMLSEEDGADMQEERLILPAQQTNNPSASEAVLACA